MEREKNHLIINKKTIAVIVPIYNTEKYLHDCIESLINQTVPFDEIILIDDGSNDKSLEICKKYQHNNSNIRLFSQNNRGVSFARNYGIKCCTSDYLLFVDSDDILNLDLVRIIRNRLWEENYDMLIYDANIYVNKKMNVYKEDIYDKSKWILDGKMTGKEFLFKMFPVCYSSIVCMSVYRTEFVWKENLLFQIGVVYSEDMLFIIKALLSACKIYYIPQRLYTRRLRENSATTSTVSVKKVCSAFFVAEELVNILWNNILCKEDYYDKFISLNLFHYNIAVQCFFELEVRNDSLPFAEKIRYFNKLILFIDDIVQLDQDGDNISNYQFALELIIKIKKICIDKMSKCKIVLNKTEMNLERIKNEHVLKKLKKFPFHDNNSVIAIYGTGHMADLILAMYRERIGEIKCDFVFIKTDATDDETYQGYSVYNVKKIPFDVQIIIISSQIYRREIWNVLMEHNIKIKIIDIYENECFDINW